MVCRRDSDPSSSRGCRSTKRRTHQRRKLRKQALGRSRGWDSTKLHFLTDGRGIPLSVTATPGQKHQAPEFESLMQACLINTFRKTRRPESLAGDKGYSSGTIRHYIAKREINDVIPTRSNETPQQDFDTALYRQRNIIERLSGWLKENRRIATRFEKTSTATWP